MFLNKKKVAAPDADRTELQETASIGTTPGQKLFGILTAVLGSAMLLGGIYYKVIKGGDSPATPTQPIANAPIKEAKLKVPLDLNTQLASSQPQQPQYGGGLFPAAQAATLQTQPPGMTPVAGANGQLGQAGQVQAQQNGGTNNPAADKIKADRQAAAARSLSGDIGNFDNKVGEINSTPALSANVIPNNGVSGPTPVQSGGGAIQGGQTAISNLLVPTATPGTSASYIQNQHMTLIKGAGISCNLDTAIMTDQMGFTSCLTDFPTYSMDGKVVLMERGTKVDGEYARGIAHGAKAIFVLWTRAVTPKGVVITLASPGTDPLGRAGLNGEVDNKFWDRYGGALMFSMMQDGISAATSKGGSSNGNTQINLGNTQATGTNAAGEILKQNSDVMPSLYKNQGGAVGITVARDLDFSTVYNLIPTASR